MSSNKDSINGNDVSFINPCQADDHFQHNKIVVLGRDDSGHVGNKQFTVIPYYMSRTTNQPVEQRFGKQVNWFGISDQSDAVELIFEHSQGIPSTLFFRILVKEQGQGQGQETEVCLDMYKEKADGGMSEVCPFERASRATVVSSNSQIDTPKETLDGSNIIYELFIKQKGTTVIYRKQFRSFFYF